MSPGSDDEEKRVMEIQLSHLIDALPDLVWTADADGLAESMNQRWCDYTGLRPDQVIGSGWQSVVHPEDRPRLLDCWRSSLCSGEAGEVQARLRRFDGAYRSFVFRSSPVRDESGSIVKWLASNTDIEDRKRAREPPAPCERELRSIIDSIPAMAWAARPDGYCDFLNQRWLDYTGMTAEQALGWGWATAFHPADREAIVELWQSRLASGAPLETEARMRRHDGVFRWFLFHANPLRDAAGNIYEWCGTNTDIEDRKRGEQDLLAREVSWRQIVDRIPGLVATMGATGEVEFLNRQTLEYFGRTPEDLKNWSLIGVVHPDDLPGIIEARAKSIETGQPYEVEHRCRRADGVYRWFQVRGLPVRNTEGAITAFYLLLTDIEDLKRTEEALRSKERNLSLLINAIPTYIHVLRSDGSVLYANQAVLEYTGLTLEDVQRPDYRARAFHPEDVARIREERGDALTRAVPFEHEQRVLNKDGTYRWMLVRYNPLLDEQGRIDRWYVAAFDIESRKHAEAELEQAYLRLAEAQRLSKTGSFVTDLLSDEHDWSEEAFRIFGFDRATKVTMQKIRDVVEPEDLPGFEAGIERSMNGAEFDFVFRIRPAGGSIKYLHAVARVLRLMEGRPLFIGALQDVTESKIAEAELRRAHDHLSEAQRLSRTGSFTLDVVRDERYWSEELYRILEIDPATRITPQTVRGIVHPEDLHVYDTLIERIIAGPWLDAVFRIVTSRGALKYLRVVAHRIEHITDRPVLIGAIQDVTAAKVAEDALSKARGELARVSRVMTLGALTASIAHEVNQPLAGIITNATTCLRMLAADPPNLDGARATTQRTLRDGNRAGEVIQRLRTLFSHKQPKYEPVDLNAATREVLALSMSELQRGHVTLRTDLYEGLPAINGDRVQLQQVLLNLILNAADAMREVRDRPRDLLIATALEHPNSVRLSVRDSGVGIDPQTLEKVFEAFYTTKAKGMGIGLAISRSIIESHQGRLWASANEGPGATFSFSIPCECETARVAAAR